MTAPVNHRRMRLSRTRHQTHSPRLLLALRQRLLDAGKRRLHAQREADATARSGVNYFGNNSTTSDFSSFNSFSVAVIFARLKSLSGTPWTISHFLPSVRIDR